MRRSCVRCPTCGQPIGETRAGVRLPALKVRIFDAIARVGEEGISSPDLLERVYDAGLLSSRPSVKCIRIHVWQINEMLDFGGADVRIVSVCRLWFLRKRTSARSSVTTEHPTLKALGRMRA